MLQRDFFFRFPFAGPFYHFQVAYTYSRTQERDRLAGDQSTEDLPKLAARSLPSLVSNGSLCSGRPPDLARRRLIEGIQSGREACTIAVSSFSSRCTRPKANSIYSASSPTNSRARATNCNTFDQPLYIPFRSVPTSPLSVNTRALAYIITLPVVAQEQRSGQFVALHA